MKKPTIRRLCLGLVQQLTALFIMVAMAGIIFNSYVAVESMNETKTYYLSPMDTEPEFEDSAVFRDIFKTAVSDITRLVVIKEQVETNGVFDPEKKIDVTQYANRTGKGNDCQVTAVYHLDDLIKWGKSGIEFTNRPMSMSEFVNYFGPATSPANFALDENGQLYFAGFLDEAFLQNTKKNTKAVSVVNTIEKDLKTKPEKELTEEEKAFLEQQKQLEEAMQLYTEEQLEDMALSYMMTEVSEEISVSREDDGSLTVYFPMLSCRYTTVDGERQLISYASDWIEYSKLQENVTETITSLTLGYEQYQNCNHLYLEGKTNLKYVVRMMSEQGITRTYTNVSELRKEEDSEITNYFSEYRRYLIYYPDSLEFTSNASMDEEEIYQFLKEYEYAYPDTTHIWIGVDTSYPIIGDAFYNANAVFQRIVPNIGLIIGLCALLAAVWIGLGIYLTVMAGVGQNEQGENVLYLNGIDHIWTEIMVVFGVGIAYAEWVGARYLMGIADRVYLSHSEVYGETLARLYEYGYFAAYGFVTSMLFNIFWYSLIRRIKSQNLWRDSFCHWILTCCRRGFRFVVTHKNTAVSTLIPYNLFILVNLVGIILTYITRAGSIVWLFIPIVLVAIDGWVGVMIFKNRAEQITIVEGIKRIRDGEVEYKLEVDNLHGDNREMADAVNNIGEGIRNAVKTSMKDEQMKTDLITNVSHDIKTPLTSIINYVDLLKRLKIDEEPAKSYINILDSKAQRLKQLTDDLVEASKISSGNIELNWEKLNLSELLNQSIGEFVEKMEERNLQMVFSGCEKSTVVYADSRRMWRVIENLFNNIFKYAMEGTRVYIDLDVENGMVEASLKNISATQMNIKADDLTERFIRGDSSRTTEGSGLGLFIAKSLTVAQGGEFTIHMDGDLFKVVLRFPEYVEKEVEEEMEAVTPEIK